MKLFSSYSNDVVDGSFVLAVSPRLTKEGDTIPPDCLAVLYRGVQTDLADNLMAAGIIRAMSKIVQSAGELLIMFSPNDIPDEMLPDEQLR